MIDFEEAGQRLRGVWRLIAGDEAWREDMDLSTEGVFRSFWAMALSAPFAVLSVLAQSGIARTTPDFASTIYAKAPLPIVLVSELGAALAAWMIAIAALTFAAKRLNAGREAAGLIAAFNWSQLLTYLVSAAPAGLFILTQNIELTAISLIAVFAFSIYVFWVVLRRNLPIDVGPAIAIIVGLSAISIGVYTLITNIAIWFIQLFS